MLLRRIRHKPNRKGIYTVSGIFFGKTFTIKYMPQMTTAIGTGNFYPLHPKTYIGMPNDGTRNFVIKRRPAAMAVKLVGGVI